MISFYKPFAFLLFVIFPIYFLLRKKILKKIQIKFALYNWKTKAKPKKIFLVQVARMFFLTAIILLIISLTEPSLRFTETVFVDNDTSIMFLIDVSPSMSILDVSTNGKELSRLDLAKDCIKNFVTQNKNIAIGLTLFASESSLLIPETLNHDIFLKRLETISVGELGNGTALGVGLATALLHSSKTSNSYLVVLCDGQNNSGSVHPNAVVKIISEKNINFFLIGFGTQDRSKVKYVDDKKSKRYVGIIEKSFDESNLKSIAEFANGNYIFATSSKTLNDAINIVSKNLETSMVKKNEYKIFDIKEYFVLSAFILLLLVWIIKKIFLRMLI